MFQKSDKNSTRRTNLLFAAAALVLTVLFSGSVNSFAQSKNADDQTQLTDGGNLILEKVIPLNRTGSKISTPSAVDNNALFSNVTTFGGNGLRNGGAAADPAAAANTITALVADDLTLIRPSNIAGYRFSVVNFDAAAVSARPRIRFYAANGANGGPGTYLGGNSFNAISFAAGSVTVFQTGVLATPIPNTSSQIWAGITFDNNSGATGATAAQLNNLGQGIFNPVDKGSSADNYFVTTANGSFLANNPAGGQGNFGGAPVANFGWEILAPTTTAASVAVSGRVLTGNRGLANARVELTGADGKKRTVVTNAFGNFTITDVEAGATYIINVSAKRYTFAPQIVSATENLSGLTFIGQP